MRPADAYRLKYRSGGSASQTVEPPNDESNTALVDSLPDELLARILSPVDLKSLVQARAVCKSWQASVEGKAVSDLRAIGDEREWQKTWWRSVFDSSMKEHIGCTCAVVGREILILGGPNDFHASDSDNLAHHLQRLELASVRQGMGPMRPEMTEYVQQRWMNEASDTIFDTSGHPRLATPELGFRRFGERLAAQSEGGAAAVVYV